MSAYGSIEHVRDASVINGGVVGKDIDDDLDAILASLVAQTDEVFASADLIVADLPVDGLVVIVPAAVTKELRTATLVAFGFVDAVLSRRCLYDLVAGSGDVCQILSDGIEGPAPGMQDDIVLRRSRNLSLEGGRETQGQQGCRKEVFVHQKYLLKIRFRAAKIGIFSEKTKYYVLFFNKRPSLSQTWPSDTYFIK